MSAPVRVLHLMGALRPSGMERMLVSAADAFAGQEVVGIVVGQGVGHPFAEELEAAGYAVRIIPAVRTPAGASALVRMLRRERPDVVHVHTEGFFLPTVLLCLIGMRTRRIVHTVHNVFSGTRGWRLRRRIQQALADRLLSEVVAPSPDVQDNERGFGRRTTLVYNWVDRRFLDLAGLRALRPRSVGEQRLLLVGNCNDAKNHELALRAVLRQGGAVLHVGDESGASGEESRLLARLAADGRLLRRGVQPPDDAILEADAYLMPSRNEGMGVALAEAISAGLPSLVADAPGLRWADGQPGVRVLALDDSAWEAALQQIGKGTAEEVRASEPVDFSPERGAREYAAAYRRALARR